MGDFVVTRTPLSAYVGDDRQHILATHRFSPSLDVNNFNVTGEMPTLRNVPVDAAVSKEKAISDWLAIKAKHGTEDCFDSGDDVDAQREARSMAAGQEQDKDWARFQSRKEAAKRGAQGQGHPGLTSSVV